MMHSFSVESCQSFVEVLQCQAAQPSSSNGYTFLTYSDLPDASLSYRQLDQQARAIAAVLQQQTRKGDRALLLFPSGLDYLAAFFGCLYAGVVAVPAYPPRRNQKLTRLQKIVADANAEVALTTSETFGLMQTQLAQTKDLSSLHYVITNNIDEDVASDWHQSEISKDTIAFLQYTSGSTGTPKGVIISHENLLSNQQMIQSGFGHNQETIFVSWLPIFHDMGLIGNILQPLYLGVPCYFMSPTAFLQKPIRWLEAISRYRGTTSGAPNFAYDLCTKRVSEIQMQSLDLSCWKVAFSGAEPIRAQTLESFSVKFSPSGFQYSSFLPCYGLAEATLFVSGSHQLDPNILFLSKKSLSQNEVLLVEQKQSDSQKVVGCGKSQLDQEIIIVDPETLEPCKADQIGEVWLTGIHIAQGYWANPKLTNEVFNASLYGDDKKKIFRSGDLGFIHNNELFITGRIKDLLIIRGRNHYPQDIEFSVEQSHPYLQDNASAAFSVEIEEEEHLVVIQEVKRKYLRQLDIEEVKQCVRRAVADNHELKLFDILLVRPLTIPKTSSGKIQRSQCCQQYLNGTFREIEKENGNDELPFACEFVSKRIAETDIPEEFYKFDVLPEYRDLQERLSRLDSEALGYPYFKSKTIISPSIIQVMGEELIDFSSYNYLGLSGHPTVNSIVKEVIDNYGTSVQASRLISGEIPLHRQLERQLADWIGVEDASIYSAGYLTNIDVISTLVGPKDLILRDQYTHASANRGSVFSGATVLSYPHNNTEALGQLLEVERPKYERALILTEGVFSTDGDIPNLPQLIALKQRYKAWLMVDEAHSIGTLGLQGRGIGEHFGIMPSAVDIWMGTLSKALASCGGYIAGSKALIYLLKHTAPGFIFSAGISPANTAASLAALQEIRKEPQRIEKLRENSQLFRHLAQQKGLNIGEGKDTPVVPVIIGDLARAEELASQAREEGINVFALGYPVVPSDSARLRFFITTLHTEEQIKYTVETISRLLIEINLRYSKIKNKPDIVEIFDQSKILNEDVINIEKWMQDWITKNTEIEKGRISRDLQFKDYGLDSLQIIELGAALESLTGLRLNEDSLYTYPTISLMASHISTLRTALRDETELSRLQSQIVGK